MGSPTDLANLMSNTDNGTSNRTNFGTFIVPSRDDSTTASSDTKESSIYVSVRSSMIPSSSSHYAPIFNESETKSRNKFLSNENACEQASRNSALKDRVKSSGKLNEPPSLTAKTRGHLSAFSTGYQSMYERAKVSIFEFFELNLPKQIYHSVQPDIESGLARKHTFSFLSVSYRSATTLPIFLAILYSYIPFFVFFLLFIQLLFNGGLLPFFSVCLFTIVGLINELCLKNLFRQPRPEASLVQSYGMPSTHCMISYSFFIWAISEALFAPLLRLFPFWLILLVAAAFLPIPWARYYLEDHTVMQCVVGCLGAIPFGILAFFIRASFFPTSAVIDAA